MGMGSVKSLKDKSTAVSRMWPVRLKMLSGWPVKKLRCASIVLRDVIFCSCTGSVPVK